MKKILKGLQQIENWTIIITFAIMVIACFIQVVNRNIFKIPVTGFEEAAKYAMIYMVMLGTEMGLRDGTQVAVTAVVDKLHGTARKAVQVIAKVIVIGFSAFLLTESWAMVLKQIQIGQLSPGLRMPMAVPYAAMPIAFALITIIQIYYLIRIFVPEKKDDSQGGEQA